MNRLITARPTIIILTTLIIPWSGALAQIVINEFHADPDPVYGDANNDGIVHSSQDEFIEILNGSTGDVNITGYAIEDEVAVRHVFPDPTILSPGCSVTVFGGGSPVNLAGLIQTASTGALGLNNSGDSITIRDDLGMILEAFAFGAEASDNQALAREPDTTGSFVKHTLVSSNPVLYSPGSDNTDHSPFVCNSCYIDDVLISNPHCDDTDFIFDVYFSATGLIDTSGLIEVYDTIHQMTLGSGLASPIALTIPLNSDTTELAIVVRDATDSTCVSTSSVPLVPLDCTTCPEPGHIVISEVMQNPAAVPDANGEWFEIRNPTDSTIDINGMIIKDKDVEMHTIENQGPLNLLPGGFLVLGIDSSMANNGGVDLDYQYTGLTFSNSFDELILTCNGVIIDSVGWDDGSTFPDPEGASMSLDNGASADENDDGIRWCASTSIFGSGDKGTPGDTNLICPCAVRLDSLSDLECVGDEFTFIIHAAYNNLTGGGLEVFDATHNSVIDTILYSGSTILIANQYDSIPFDILLRDVNDHGCSSQLQSITPLPCTICPPDYAGVNALAGVVLSDENYETEGHIETTQTIEASAIVTYDSAMGITLNPGFESIMGSVIRLIIDGCPGALLRENPGSRAYKD